MDINLVKVLIKLRRSLSSACRWWEKDGRGQQEWTESDTSLIHRGGAEPFNESNYTPFKVCLMSWRSVSMISQSRRPPASCVTVLTSSHDFTQVLLHVCDGQWECDPRSNSHLRVLFPLSAVKINDKKNDLMNIKLMSLMSLPLLCVCSSLSWLLWGFFMLLKCKALGAECFVWKVRNKWGILLLLLLSF